jgi:hypothetical protein
MRCAACLIAALLFAPSAGWGAKPRCAPDALEVGALCVDRFEASVWQVPEPASANRKLVERIEQGTVALEDLVQAGATQLGCTAPPFEHAPFPPEFPLDGGWTPLPGEGPPTPGVYAVSLSDVRPTACVTWFQAVQACFLSGKRLPSNEEWQRAAVGTPDPAPPGAEDCNVASSGADPAGDRASCVSSWGAFDMVGNLWEWTGDWADRNPTSCTTWLSDDFSCFGGDGSTPDLGLPGPLFRGGSFTDGTAAGPYAVKSDVLPEFQNETLGFRCVR